jgi:ABC-2 type transport system permease protein
MINALRYESRRIASIRSTWILLGGAVIAGAGVAALFNLMLNVAVNASKSDPSLGPPPTVTLTQAIGLGIANAAVWGLFATVAAQTFGQEYRHGTIRLTLTAFPKRWQVFVAKIIVSLAWITVAWVVAFAIVAVIFSSNGVVELPNAASLAAYAVRAWLIMVGFCLIVFSVTVLTRVLALGVILPILLQCASPFIILFAAAVKAVQWLPDYLPITAMTQFAAGESMLRSGTVSLVWVAGLVAAAFAVFHLRDA